MFHANIDLSKIYLNNEEEKQQKMFIYRSTNNIVKTESRRKSQK